MNKIYVTTSDGRTASSLHFHRESNIEIKGPSIRVNPEITYQTFLGFGGAMTEAAAAVLSQASKKQQKQMLEAYFDQNQGLGYVWSRLSIHSCDFSLKSYTYVSDDDPSLSSFDLRHEDELVIPALKEAQKMAGHPLRLLASPWSPPSFMKTNGDMAHGGKLLPQYRESWAHYLAQYVQEMKARGFEIEALTVQNEPDATQTWESCLWSGEEEGAFIADNLFPALSAIGRSDIKLLAWDHNRDIFPERAKETMSITRAIPHLWGFAYHWYCSEAFENVASVHNAFPDKHLLFTEGCVELGGIRPTGLWEHGERYGRNIIGDLNHFCEGWIDWNLFLDERGGPNHVGNYCEAPIMYDRQKKEIIYNPSYHYLWHLAHFILPGSIRLECLVEQMPNVWATSFKRPDEKKVIVIQNEGEERNLVLTVGTKKADLALPSHSIATVIIDLEKEDQ